MVNVTSWSSPGYSNPNLLKNWDFRQVVNQRGQSSYTVGARYTIDMWQGNDLCTVDVLQNSIKISTTASAPIWALSQLIEIVDISQYRGATLTISCSAIAVTGIVKLVIFDGYHAQEVPITSKGIFCLTYTVPEDAAQIALKMYLHDSSSSVELKAAKLEVGTVSTLALDLMQPPNYAKQLWECQRYLQIIKINHGGSSVLLGGGGKTTGSNITCMIELAREMRVRPTILINDLSKISIASGNGTGVILHPTNVTWRNFIGTKAEFDMTTDASSVPYASFCPTYLELGGEIILSSEL